MKLFTWNPKINRNLQVTTKHHRLELRAQLYINVVNPTNVVVNQHQFLVGGEGHLVLTFEEHVQARGTLIESFHGLRSECDIMVCHTRVNIAEADSGDIWDSDLEGEAVIERVIDVVEIAEGSFSHREQRRRSSVGFILWYKC